MDGFYLQPWMLLADWREDLRPWVLVDLAQWPADVALDRLPPVPVIGVGPASHPAAPQLDARIEAGFALERLSAAIAKVPVAAASLIHLLRATANVPAPQVLIAESMAMAMLQGGAEHAGWLARQRPAAPSPPGQVHLDRRGPRLDITIERGHARNAIDRAMRDALFDAFSLPLFDDSIATVHLRALGRAFSVGADLAEFGTTTDGASAHMIRARTLPAWPMIRSAASFEVHVQGACVGSGLEMAAFAGRVTAAPAAWFQLPEIAMGILPGFGGTVSIPRRIGRQRAALLMLSGRRISAQLALDWGLVDAIVDEPPGNPGGRDQI